MKTKSLLLLIVFLGSIIPVTSAGAENPTQRILDDSVTLLHASRAILLDEQDISGTSRAPGEMLVVNPAVQTDAGDDALANLIQATKDQRNALDASCRQLKEVYSTSDRKCERQVLEEYCSSQKDKFNTRLGFLHKLRGDRRKLFTKIYHRIKRSGENVWRAVGPVGRRLLRRVGPEVLEVVLSGGTLSGGLLRKIVIKEARNIGKGELERLLSSGVERLLTGQAAFAQAAGVGDCTTEKLQEARKQVEAGLSGEDPGDQSDEDDDDGIDLEASLETQSALEEIEETQTVLKEDESTPAPQGVLVYEFTKEKSANYEDATVGLTWAGIGDVCCREARAGADSFIVHLEFDMEAMTVSGWMTGSGQDSFDWDGLKQQDVQGSFQTTFSDLPLMAGTGSTAWVFTGEGLSTVSFGGTVICYEYIRYDWQAEEAIYNHYYCNDQLSLADHPTQILGYVYIPSDARGLRFESFTDPVDEFSNFVRLTTSQPMDLPAP